MPEEGMECYGSVPGQSRAWFPLVDDKKGQHNINYLNIDWKSLQPVYHNGNEEMIENGAFGHVKC